MHDSVSEVRCFSHARDELLINDSLLSQYKKRVFCCFFPGNV